MDKDGNRTSINSPLRVDWLLQDVGPRNGQIGLTLCPGKKGTSIFGGYWDRSLAADMDRLKAYYKVDLLISLIEAKEYADLKINDYTEIANERGIAVYKSQIVDLHAPTIEQANHIVDVAMIKCIKTT